ncbi:transglutaminase-like cysteine peptidase [Polycladidibacter stylochi]|uniref:transglutaminase-like cysteine peptidase n=1 Tax=Polycladidibacter stylochi TaxID=1807766 RepID=UPI00082E2E7D|nr:transglutaminase-like cysteine peptidase [Pseudovibrio stylochi]
MLRLQILLPRFLCWALVVLRAGAGYKTKLQTPLHTFVVKVCKPAANRFNMCSKRLIFAAIGLLWVQAFFLPSCVHAFVPELHAQGILTPPKHSALKHTENNRSTRHAQARHDTAQARNPDEARGPYNSAPHDLLFTYLIEDFYRAAKTEFQALRHILRADLQSYKAAIAWVRLEAKTHMAYKARKAHKERRIAISRAASKAAWQQKLADARVPPLPQSKPALELRTALAPNPPLTPERKHSIFQKPMLSIRQRLQLNQMATTQQQHSSTKAELDRRWQEIQRRQYKTLEYTRVSLQQPTAGKLMPLPAPARKLTDKLREMPRGWQLAAINKRVNQMILYESDQKVWGIEDYWAAPREVLQTLRGDCEDYAILKYWLLVHLGFDRDKMQVVAVYDRKLKEFHAILQVTFNGAQYILDNRSQRLRRREDVGTYQWLHQVG